MSNILIIDDQPYLRELFSHDLIKEAYQVWSAADAESVKGYLENSNLDLVLLELSVQGFRGWGMLKEIRQKTPQLPVLIVTAYDGYKNEPRASESDGYVVKDFIHLDKLKERYPMFLVDTRSAEPEKKRHLWCRKNR